MLWGGNGLVGKRVETVRARAQAEPAAPDLRQPGLHAYNPPREDKVMSGPYIGNFIRNAGGDARRAETPYSPKRTQAPFSWRSVVR